MALNTGQGYAETRVMVTIRKVYNIAAHTNFYAFLLFMVFQMFAPESALQIKKILC